MLWQVGKMLDEDDVNLWFKQKILDHGILNEFLICNFLTEEPQYLDFETFKESINEGECNKIVAKETKKIVIL
ncbi:MULTISPECIES: hypothetical protein [Bartonella]|nr:hypothetical protein [Bartonella henselae]ETS06122.1 hypothetical protein Q653_01510 [Bartonella henselae JK 42]ETS11136.1 hypothetical protein Q652_01483 [Bartonella henselae JK 41]KEC55911.1 hypothetical protein O97_01446 [Bartonella henselae str. Zeus]KEC58968.1 hypothetical protein O95_01459 [Bartonella henselae JK 53]MDM9983806.1 hypothetical protein [Bartonella henselae]